MVKHSVNKIYGKVKLKKLDNERGTWKVGNKDTGSGLCSDDVSLPEITECYRAQLVKPTLP